MMECIGDAEGVRDGRRRPLFKAGDDLRLEMNEWIKPDIHRSRWGSWCCRLPAINW